MSTLAVETLIFRGRLSAAARRKLLLLLARVGSGGIMLGRPTLGLSLLGYPDDGRRAKAVVRLLGARHLAQAVVEARTGPDGRRVGAAVDGLHALSCLAYARRSSRGRTAGLRSALLATAFGGGELAASRGRTLTEGSGPRPN